MGRSFRKLYRPRGFHTGIKLYYTNLVRGLKVTGLNQVWSTDFTYIQLVNEYVYLNAVIDVYTRKILGWFLSKYLSHKFCLEALRVAINRYSPAKGVIHHSDRGVQRRFN